VAAARRQSCSRYLVVARRGHPALDQPLDLDRYAAFGHVLAAPGGTLSGIVDHALTKAARKRRVAIAVPYFLAALATVARTDLIATVPRRIALLNAASFGLGTAAPPLPIRRFSVCMIWSRRSNTDPAITWLRNLVENTAGSLPD
jgi:DNA-binding transcriptional LysR family regulator